MCDDVELIRVMYVTKTDGDKIVYICFEGVCKYLKVCCKYNRNIRKYEFDSFESTGYNRGILNKIYDITGEKVEKYYNTYYISKESIKKIIGYSRIMGIYGW